MEGNYIQFTRENCANCYKCIRACPVKSIAFKDNRAQIIQQDCIQCGACFVVCPQNAKTIRTDYHLVKQRIKDGKKVIASLAPSFVANYTGANITEMKNAMLKLGFYDVQETALGATVVKTEYENILKEKQSGVVISSCCHTLNSMIEKYYPMALPYLAKVVTPMQAHGRMIKEEHPDAYTVFIGPCISKKAEIEQYRGDIDAAITFMEFTQWLKEAGVSIETATDRVQPGKARLFPTTGGIIKTMTLQPDIHYIAIDGPENCERALQDVINGNLKDCFIEMSFCSGSCIGGPAMEEDAIQSIRDYIAVMEYAGKEDFEVKAPASIKKNHIFLGGSKRRPGARDIDKILDRMGKRDPAKRLNCGSCGYNSCYDKAVAVWQGKAQINMCLPFLIEKSQSFSDNVIEHTPNGIIVMDEMYTIQQINQAACDIVNLPMPKTIIGLPVDRIIDTTVIEEAIETNSVIKDRVTYLADYDKYISMTAFHDSEYKVSTLIIRDVTDEQTAKERKAKTNANAIEITGNIIDKQMRVVQEIASLLGETVAETQIALHKMEETLRDE